jgi:hypothetical protein
MGRLPSLSRAGRLLLALVVGGAVFGIATAVQADIPDAGVIHGCYGKAGTPYKGNLRVRDASQGEQCRFYENQLDWNQTGPTGATGATGATGPAGVPGLAISPLTLTVIGGPGNLTITITCADTSKIAVGGYSYDLTNPGNLTQLGAGNAGVLAGGAANNEWTWTIRVNANTPGDSLQFQRVCANPPVSNAAPINPSTSTLTIKITSGSLKVVAE